MLKIGNLGTRAATYAILCVIALIPALVAAQSKTSNTDMQILLDKIKATKNNADFFDSMRRG